MARHRTTITRKSSVRSPQDIRHNRSVPVSSVHRTLRALPVLLKREEILSKVFRLVPDIVLVTERDSGRILDVNDRYLEVMGFRREDVIGVSTVDLHCWLCPEDRDAFLTAIPRDGTCASFKTTLCTAGGKRIPVVIAARVFDVAGISCIVSVIRDVTELHEKEEALEYRLALERLVASISSRFISLRAEDIDREIDRALDMVGSFAAADRCSLLQFMPDGIRVDVTHEWCRTGIAPLIHRRKAIAAHENLPLLVRCVRSGVTYTIFTDMPSPDASSADIAYLRSQGTASIVAVPTLSAGQPSIAVCCEAVGRPQAWSGDVSALLKIAGEIFISAIMRARSERELRDSEQRFRTLFDNAQDGLLVADPATMCFFTGNRSILRMLGYTPEELTALSVGDIHPPEAMPHIVKRFRKIAAGEATRAEAIPVRRKDGSIFFADISSSLVTLNNKPYVLGSFRDITAQKKAAEERLRLFAAVEQASEFIAMLDADGSFRYINPSGQRMFGYTLDEVYGKDAFITDKGMYAPSFYREIWDVISGGKDWIGRLTCKRRDGTVMEVEQHISPVRNPDGSIACFLSIGRDITNELRLEQALRQAQKMEAIGTLAGGIAHDFNNILSVITGYAQMLLSASAEGSREETGMVEILRAGRRARDLVRQILTFSRQTEQERKPVHIAPVIKETLRFLKSSLSSSIVMEQQIESEADVVMADPTQIHQIIMNLCTNAAHAMKERGGILRVTLAPVELGEHDCIELPELKPGPFVRLSVSDTGQGMRQDVIERIFDPYFTTKPQGEGTGLGLSVVHGIVKQHSGAIRVASTVGAGTCFDLWFPRVTATADIPMDERRPVQGGSGRILFVDDDPAVVKMGHEMLERLGYSVVGLTGSQAALEVFSAAPDRYDLLITDKTMPGMNGFDLAAAIRYKRPDLPVIMITGFSDAEDPDHAHRLGIQEFVMKPLVLHEIAEIIGRLLRPDAGNLETSRNADQDGNAS